MSQLIRYEAACRALAECRSVDEVKSWSDKAAAMQAYGRMAKDKTLEVDAAEIRIRAERRLGEMLAQQKADGGLNRGAASMAGNQYTGKVVPSSESSAPTLADVGISHNLSSRAQKLAAVPEAEFEAEVGQWRERVSEEGRRVSARLEAAGERAQKQKRSLEPERPADIPEMTAQDHAQDFDAVIDSLTAEVEQLRDRLAVEAMDATEEEKTLASETISELRAKVKALTAELDAVKASRDSYMREAAEAKKQAVYWRKQAEKVSA